MREGVREEEREINGRESCYMTWSVLVVDNSPSHSYRHSITSIIRKARIKAQIEKY